MLVLPAVSTALQKPFGPLGRGDGRRLGDGRGDGHDACDAITAVATMPSRMERPAAFRSRLPSNAAAPEGNRAGAYDDAMPAGRLTPGDLGQRRLPGSGPGPGWSREGIDAQLTGALDGVYGFTVGDMARVDVYVPEDQLDDARYVLLADEVDASDGGAERVVGRRHRASARRPRWPWVVACRSCSLAVTTCAVSR